MINKDLNFIAILELLASLKHKRIGSVWADNTLKGEIAIKFNEEKTDMAVEFNGINGAYAIQALLKTIVFILNKGKITDKEEIYGIIFYLLKSIDTPNP